MQLPRIRSYRDKKPTEHNDCDIEPEYDGLPAPDAENNNNALYRNILD